MQNTSQNRGAETPSSSSSKNPVRSSALQINSAPAAVGRHKTRLKSDEPAAKRLKTSINGKRGGEFSSDDDGLSHGPSGSEDDSEDETKASGDVLQRKKMNTNVIRKGRSGKLSWADKHRFRVQGSHMHQGMGVEGDLFKACSDGFAEGVRVLIPFCQNLNAREGAADRDGLGYFFATFALLCGLQFLSFSVLFLYYLTDSLGANFSHGPRIFFPEFENEKSTGCSPLHIAAMKGHLSCVKILVESGADRQVRTTRGITPLQIAAKRGHTKVVEYLATGRVLEKKEGHKGAAPSSGGAGKEGQGATATLENGGSTGSAELPTTLATTDTRKSRKNLAIPQNNAWDVHPTQQHGVSVHRHDASSHLDNHSLSKKQRKRMQNLMGQNEDFYFGDNRHVPRPPLNTEFNSVFKYGLKMRLSPKFTPFYLNLGVLREFEFQQQQLSVGFSVGKC